MKTYKQGLLAVPLYKYFFAISLLLMIGGVWKYYYIKSFLKNAVQTKAIITSVKTEVDLVQDDNGNYEQKFSHSTNFQYKDSKETSIDKSYSGGHFFGEEGDSIGILYNAHDPGWYMFEEDVKSAKSIWLFFGFAAFFLLFSFIFYKRHQYVLRNPHVNE